MKGIAEKWSETNSVFYLEKGNAVIFQWQQ